MIIDGTTDWASGLRPINTILYFLVNRESEKNYAKHALFYLPYPILLTFY